MRLRVVPPQVAQDLGVVLVGVGADEVGAAVGQQVAGQGEPVVILGDRLVEVDPEVEGRAIRVRERAPAASRAPPPASTCSRRASISRRRIHALGWRETRSVRFHRRTFQIAAGVLVIDQRLERVDRLVAAEQVDVDRDMLVGEQRLRG